MNKIYSNLPFSRKDFLHLKCREYFIIGQNVSSFHCLYMLRIVNIIFKFFQAVTIVHGPKLIVWHFLHLPKIMDKKKNIVIMAISDSFKHYL